MIDPPWPALLILVAGIWATAWLVLAFVRARISLRERMCAAEEDAALDEWLIFADTPEKRQAAQDRFHTLVSPPHRAEVFERPLRCRWRWHKWRFSHGSHNLYFECSRCGGRTVRLGRGGYQPIDDRWLMHREPRRRGPGQSRPVGGWDRVVFWQDGTIQL